MRITLAVAHGLLLAVAFAGGTTAEERVVMSYPLLGPEPTHRIVSVDAAKRQLRIEKKPSVRAGLFEGSGGILLPTVDGGPLDTLVRIDIDEILDGPSLPIPGLAGLLGRGDGGA